MCSALRTNIDDVHALSLAELLGSLQQVRREQVRRLAAELVADPERMLPDAGMIRLTVDLHTCIDAVKAVIEEETRDGNES